MCTSNFFTLMESHHSHSPLRQVTYHIQIPVRFRHSTAKRLSVLSLRVSGRDLAGTFPSVPSCTLVHAHAQITQHGTQMLSINCQKHDIVRITLAGVVEENALHFTVRSFHCRMSNYNPGPLIPPTVRLWSPTLHTNTVPK